MIMSEKKLFRSIITTAFTVSMLLFILLGSSMPGTSTGGIDFHADVTSGNAPLTVHFTDDTSDNLNPGSWDWNLGDAGSTQRNPTHTYNSPGTYTVSLTVSNGSGPLGRETKTDYIVVGEPILGPTADFIADTVSGQAPLLVHFTGLSSGGTLSYDWDFGDGKPHSYVQSPEHTYTIANNYTVRLTVSNPGGSSVKESRIIVSPSNNSSIVVVPGAVNETGSTITPVPAAPTSTPAPVNASAIEGSSFSLSGDAIQLLLAAVIAVAISGGIIYYFFSLSKRNGDSPAPKAKKPPQAPAAPPKPPAVKAIAKPAKKSEELAPDYIYGLVLGDKDKLDKQADKIENIDQSQYKYKKMR